jgi:hypothetical protein
VQILSIVSHAKLFQHVVFPGHCHHHTLDLVISAVDNDSLLFPVFTHTPYSPSDCIHVVSSINITPKPFLLLKHSFCSVISFNIQSLFLNILPSVVITDPFTNLSDLVDCFNPILLSILNEQAPVKTKLLYVKPANPWFTSAHGKL